VKIVTFKRGGKVIIKAEMDPDEAELVRCGLDILSPDRPENWDLAQEMAGDFYGAVNRAIELGAILTEEL
jgi:hypothetical protein